MEKQVMQQVQLLLSRLGLRVFRNNTGMGWQGKIARQSQVQIVIDQPRPLEAGLVKGSSDLIGWTSVTVTQEMVGKQIAIFAAIEVKTPGGKLTEEQRNFLNAVHHAGGLGICVKSEEEAAAQVAMFNTILGVASS